MRRPGGYAVISSPDRATRANFDKFRCDTIDFRSGIYEVDTFTCCHCNRVIHVKPKAPMDEFGSMCRNCMDMVCPTCADGPCIPFQKKLEQAEHSDYVRKQYERCSI